MIVRLLTVSALALLTLASPAAAQSEGRLEVRLVPNLAGAPSRLEIEASGQRFESGGEVPRSIAVRTPRGARFDPGAVAARCTERQARAFACPAASRIGGGTAEGTVGGSLLGGASFAFTTDISLFLAPARRGEIAGVIVQGRERRTGLRGSARGSLRPLSTRRFGAELRFAIRESQPVPAGLTLNIDRVALRVGARRTVAGRRRTLLRNPPVCRGSFPYQIRVQFQRDTVVRNGAIPCRARAARQPSFTG